MNDEFEEINSKRKHNICSNSTDLSIVLPRSVPFRAVIVQGCKHKISKLCTHETMVTCIPYYHESLNVKSEGVLE